MAKAKETLYFSHDADASADPRIAQLLSVYKFEGYGWYWRIIEIMRLQSDYKITIEGKYFYNGLAETLRTDVERALKFVDDCIEEFKLFESNGKSFWSNSLLIRMKKMETLREQRRIAGKASAQKRQKIKEIGTTVEQPLNECGTDVEQNGNEIQQKKRKEKKRKENKDIKENNKKKKSHLVEKDFNKFLKDEKWITETAKSLDTSAGNVRHFVEKIRDTCISKNYTGKYRYFDLKLTIRNWMKNDFGEGGGSSQTPTRFEQSTGRELKKGEIDYTEDRKKLI